MSKKKAKKKTTKKKVVVKKKEAEQKEALKEKAKKKLVMVIARSRAVRLFEYCNYKTASKWDSKKLETKLASLPEMVDLTKVKNDKVKALLKEIINATSIEVVPGKKATKTAKKKTTTGPVSRKKEAKKTAKKKVGKKTVTKKKVGKSNKEKVYERFLKVKPAKALDYCERWWKDVNKEVQLTTIRSWVSQWKKGKALPSCAKKK